MGLFSNLFMKKDKTRTEVTKTAEKPKEVLVKKDSPAQAGQKKESASKPSEWNLSEGLLSFTLDNLSGKVKKTLETPGNAKPVGMRFDIGGTDNIGVVAVDPSGQRGTGEYILVVYVLRKYRDRAFSHNLKAGTLDEILEYLLTESCFSDVKDSLHKLSDQVDEFYAGLRS